MTPAQTRLIKAMKDEIAAGRWTALTGSTARWMRVLPMPEGFPKDWTDQDTYEQILFLTVVGSTERPWSIILGRVASPAGGRTDQAVSFKRAMAVLANPEGEFG